MEQTFNILGDINNNETNQLFPQAEKYLQAKTIIETFPPLQNRFESRTNQQR